MSKLKDSQQSINSVSGKFGTIIGYLKEIETQDAIQMVDWFNTKCVYAYKEANNMKFHKLPEDMKRGDIVLAELGMNIHPELSDNNTDKHFVLIWGQQGRNFIIIPLTKHPQPISNKYSVDLGIIEGLPFKVNTYAKIDAIRSLSVRRLHRIKEQPEGKIILSNSDLLNKINMIFIKQFIH